MAITDWKDDKKLISRISKAIMAGNISHAYIIEAPSFIDKLKFAKEFIKAIMCLNNRGMGCDECISCKKINHDNMEDLYIVQKDGLSVKDDDILSLQKNLAKKPNGERNIAIICDADTMTVRAQNRLLKTLEEPTAGTIIVLLSENSSSLLETVRSRCITYRLNGLDSTDNSKIAVARTLIESIMVGQNFFHSRKILTDNIKSREQAIELIDSMQKIYRDIMLKNNDIPNSNLQGLNIKNSEITKAIHLIEEARRDLLIKVNYNYALKNLIIKLSM